MAFVCPNLVQETTTTTGTGAVTLLGAVSGALDFDSQLANGDTTPYSIVNSDASEWEVGIGTFSTTGPTLTRTTVLNSSAGTGVAETFTAGTKNVYAALPGATVEDLIDQSGTGMLAKTAANAYTQRTITAGTNMSVTNGNGVSGNPTIALGDHTKIYAAEYLQTVSDIINGAPVSIFRFINDSYHSGIRARTDTNDHGAAFSSAISASAHIVVPDGKYKISTGPLTITGKDFILEGLGHPELNFDYSSGTGGIHIGQTSYLSDDNAGDYFVQIKNLDMVETNLVTEMIEIEGLRRVLIDNVIMDGGATQIYARESWAGSVISRCKLKNSRGHSIYLLDENDSFKISQTTVGSANSLGLNVVGTTTGLNGLTVDRLYCNGCGAGVYMVGTLSAIEINGARLLNNTSYNLRIDNTTQNIEGFTFTNSHVDGSDVEIGTSASGGNIESAFIGPNVYNNADLTVISGNKVSGIVHPQTVSGTSTVTIPQSGAGANVLMADYPQYRYSITPTEAGASSDNGAVGDIRWAYGRLSCRNLADWQWVQTQKILSRSGTPSIFTLPTGSTPSTSGLYVCKTNNTGTTNITSFTAGWPGQQLIIVGADGGNTTLIHSTNIVLNNGTNNTISDNEVVHLVSTDGTIFVQV